jgi:threonine dehydrogenase-like Zn-dependent dehydrogenase
MTRGFVRTSIAVVVTALLAPLCATVLSSAPATAAGVVVPTQVDGGPTLADVVVVGGGPSGIAAALSAKDAGARTVVLLERTDYLGGQVAAGVGTMDEGSRDRFDQRADGIWNRIVRAFLDEYARLGWPHASTCYGAGSSGRSVCVSPSVGRRVYTRLLQDAGVIVQLGVDVAPVMTGTRITGVRWTRTIAPKQSDVIATSVVIDASENGSVLVPAGAAYRSGNGLGNTPGSAPAGHIQRITYAAVVRSYGGGTMPKALDLVGAPFPTPVGDTNPAATKARVLAYFATRVVKGGSSYNNSQGLPWSPTWALQYRGLPNPGKVPYFASQPWRITRTVLNYANDYPTWQAGDLGGAELSARYLEDPAYQHRIDCRAKLRTVQFVWYMQNKLGQPTWSVATDEGFDTPWSRTQRCNGVELKTTYAAFEAAMPVIPYTRESRRGVGLTTLTGSQVLRTPHGEAIAGPHGETSASAALVQPSDTIAIGYYRSDMHGGSAAADLESGLETTADRPATVGGVVPVGPFGIPLRALVSADVQGLILAERNISQTRIVNGATRVQPEMTAVGAAAGTLAALSIARGVPPSAVPARDVQYVLTRSGQFLSVSRFLDIDRDDPATAPFELAALAQIDPDRSHTAANPDATVTRATAATWVRRAAGLSRVATVGGVLRDLDAAAQYALDAEALRLAGVPVACATGRFCPDALMTRAELLRWAAYALDAAHGTTFTSTPLPPTPVFDDLAGVTGAAAVSAYAAHLASDHGTTFGASLVPGDPLLRRDLASWLGWEPFDPMLR